MQIQFEANLPLTDVKAQLAIARMAKLGEIVRTLPGESEFARLAEQIPLQVLIESDRPAEEIRQAADVAGVALIELEEGANEFEPSAPPASAKPIAAPVEKLAAPVASACPEPAAEPEEEGIKARVAETVRVDIERLDHLMNLAGELVVNKARFVQIARQMGPAFKKSSFAGRTRAFGESMRRALLSMKAHDGQAAETNGVNWSQYLTELEAEIGVLEEQARIWEESRRHFGQVTEAIDQLSRVSNSLQRGVLDTRMVPVAPLFNRFKRTVRDISLELQKKVNLEIKGEKTELDKRMIDELGDPLIHLVRNSIDHGIESAELRAAAASPKRAPSAWKPPIAATTSSSLSAMTAAASIPTKSAAASASAASSARSRSIPSPNRNSSISSGIPASARPKSSPIFPAAASAWTSSRRASPN